MIIDLILDRFETNIYNVDDFVSEVEDYGNDEIVNAFNSGNENAAKKALCKYIVDNNYNKNICSQINYTQWLPNTNVEKVPTWALLYMINGDPSDLTEEEIKIIDNCGFEPLSECDENGFAIDNEYSHPYFSCYPAFGILPCEVEDWIVRYK